MNRINEAVILMAGTGSRLQVLNQNLPKPLTPILGRPLVSYTIDALAAAGITVLNAVVGFESAALLPRLKTLVPPAMQLRLITNPDWQKQNGISVLAAAPHLTAPFLLTMSDHLFDQAIVDLLIARSDCVELNLAIDKKLDSIFDLDDAMKVQIRQDRVVAIAKDLPTFDAIDTGIFVCPTRIFDYLERAKSGNGRGDCSLADGVRFMAGDGAVRAIDIGDAWWQDVDTPQMLQNAEEHYRSKLARSA